MSKAPRIQSFRYLQWSRFHNRIGVFSYCDPGHPRWWSHDGTFKHFPTHAEALADARKYIESNR